ncbi:MAG: short-chain dehydrogenase [Robiginitomaculum sp.]|nr:MAG: short-chain dehydrogenase [Robiginitomaculum sp.]
MGVVKTTKNKPSNGAALVTGAAGGIGRALVLELASKGYDIIAVDRLEPELYKLGRDLKSQFPKLNYKSIVMNLSKPEAAETLYSECKSMGIKVDVLVNNVGFGKMGEHVLQSAEVMTDMLLLNNLLMTKLCLFFGKEMKARGNGYILNVASLVGFSSSPFFSAYSGTKAYVISFSVGIARELGEFGVQVSCLCPGTTESNFLDTAEIDDVSARGMRKFASAFIASPKTVAKAGITGLFKGRIVIVPTLFLSVQSFFLRTLTIEFISNAVHKKIIKQNGKQAS